MLDQRLIEQVIEGNDIVSVIEQYLPLKKSGQNYKACCPFHEEKTASFTVSDSKQIFKCFGCGQGGNVIQFVKEMEKISFFEALEKLAARAGIKLEREKGVNKVQKTRTGLLQKAYELAADYYQKNLKQYGRNALDYLAERKISAETISRFQLGFALNSNSGVLTHLTKHQFNQQLIQESGLVTSGQYGITDLFRDRLIFPIHSVSGKVVAFGSRAITEKYYGGKYINSPTTAIYTKGKELYGFHLSKNEVRKQNKIILTEGNFDFLRLYESGFTNSAATLGTALTTDQIKLISRFANNVYLLFDGDLAGKNAAIKGASGILTAGLTPHIIQLPLGEDADSFLLKNKAESLQRLIDESLTLPEFVKSDDLIELEEKEKINLMMETARGINDSLGKELFLKSVALTFDITLQTLTRTVQKKQQSRTPQTKDYSVLEQVFKNKYQEERDFLIHLLNGSYSENFSLDEIEPALFLVEGYKKVFETLRSIGYIMEENQLPSVLARLEDVDPMQVKLLSELSFMKTPACTYDQALNDMKIRKCRFDLKRLVERVQRGEMTGEEGIREKIELLTEMRKLSNQVINKTI